MPGGSLVSRSFRLCTAKSIRPIQQRLVDFLGEQALAADIGQPPVLHRVAGGGMACSSKHVHAAQYGQKLFRLFRKARVCTSASGEARVPTRNGRSR